MSQSLLLQFSVGSVEGVPFTACTSGSDIIILASNFSRVQQITVNSAISSLDCSTDVGKIAAAYDNKMVVFEPIPLVSQQQQQQQPPPPSPPPPPAGTAKLDYKWVQTANIESETPITVMSFNLEGTRLVAGGQTLQLWIVEGATKTNWQCVWSCKTASNITYLKYSPDGALFCSASKSDRLVKIWYENNTGTTLPSTTNTVPLSPIHRKGFSFIYIAHPLPVTGIEWRRTSKYTPRGAVANIMITSCRDNIARVWVQTLLPAIDNFKPETHFHLACMIEPDHEHLQRSDSVNSTTEQIEDGDSALQFVVHWINNKEIHINRSIEQLLHDMLIRILKGSNAASSSTNSPQSAGESCSGSEKNNDDLDDANDDTITAQSSKKLRHKLCRKMNKQRALAASGRRDPGDSDDNSNNRTVFPNSAHNGPSNNSSNHGRASPVSLVEEFDKTLESLLKKWQISTDLLFSINKSNGTLTFWQVKYLDGEDTSVFRQVQIDKLCCLRSALPHYDAITMSLNVNAYSPSAYLDVKRAYLAVTGSSNAVGLTTTTSEPSSSEQLSPVDVPGILSLNTNSVISINNSITPLDNSSSRTSLGEIKDNANVNSPADSDPSIFIVTQHLSGILGLWKLNFDSAYPKVQSVDLVTRITGLPIDPAWLRDGTLIVEYKDDDSVLITKWITDDARKRCVSRSSQLPVSPSQIKINPYNFEESTKSSLICNLPSVDEEVALLSMQALKISQEESHNVLKDSYRASQMASAVNILPQYHLKHLVGLLAFGKLQRVKAILNHLVNCLVQLETNQDKSTGITNSTPWSHRSRTLSVVAQSAPSFQNSFDIDNPSSTIQQHVVEEIELDYIEVTSIRPLPLYSILDADIEKTHSVENKSKAHQEFSTSYESIMRARSQVDETLDEILGESTIQTLNKQKELKRIANDAPDKGSLTNFNPKKAKLLTRALTHTHLPGLSNVDQMHLLAVADAVALFDASPEDINDIQDEDNNDSSHYGMGMVATNIAIDSLDDRGLRFLTAMRQHIYLTRCLPMKQRNELKSGVGNHNLVWAFHSESQDELISLIPCVQRNKPEWPELREFGIGWWLKKLEVLRKLIDKVAQSAYQAKQDPLDAALFYLAMKKKSLVCALLRRVNCDKRLLKLFEQDFNDPVNRKKALKNAYALLGLHRFEHAAAFFILAGSIWDAVEVCINNLHDIQLAIILIRLYDNDANVPSNLRKLLFTEILGSKRPTEPTTTSTQNSAQQGVNANIARNSSIDRRSSNPGGGGGGAQYNYDPKCAHQDPFLRSMAFWKLGDYLSAVHTLLESDVGQQRHRPSIAQATTVTNYQSSNSRRNSEHLIESASTAVGLQQQQQSGSNCSGNVSVSASVFNFYLFLKDQPLVVKHKQQLLEEVEIKKRTSPVEEEVVHCHRARSLSSGELGFDEHGISRAVKQSSTEFEVLNETTRLVDKYSDEATAEIERRLFFSTAHAYLEAGCPLLALEVLCSEDHLNMSKAQRMKFVACLHILMNELNTLASSSHVRAGSTNKKFGNQFTHWLRRSVEALKKICSYAGAYPDLVQNQELQPGESSTDRVVVSGSSDSRSHVQQPIKGSISSLAASSSSSSSSSSDDHDNDVDDRQGDDDLSQVGFGGQVSELMWVRSNEPILRTMLTYCNLHSVSENSLTTVRLELLGLLKKLSSSFSAQSE